MVETHVADLLLCFQRYWYIKTGKIEKNSRPPVWDERCFRSRGTTHISAQGTQLDSLTWKDGKRYSAFTSATLRRVHGRPGWLAPSVNSLDREFMPLLLLIIVFYPSFYYKIILDKFKQTFKSVSKKGMESNSYVATWLLLQNQ